MRTLRLHCQSPVLGERGCIPTGRLFMLTRCDCVISLSCQPFGCLLHIGAGQPLLQECAARQTCCTDYAAVSMSFIHLPQSSTLTSSSSLASSRSTTSGQFLAHCRPHATLIRHSRASSWARGRCPGNLCDAQACLPPPPPPPPGPGKPGHLVWRSSEYGPGTSARAIDNAAPVVSNGAVVFMSAIQDWTVYSPDAVTGQLHWAATEPNTTLATAVSVANGTVFLASAVAAASGYGVPRLRALDAFTGATKWQLDVGAGDLKDRPVVADGVVYLVMTANQVYPPPLYPPKTLLAVGADYGELRWSTNVSGSSAAPAVAEGIVFVTAADNSIFAFNTSTGRQVWNTSDVSNQWSTPVVAGGLLHTSQEQVGADPPPANPPLPTSNPTDVPNRSDACANNKVRNRVKLTSHSIPTTGHPARPGRRDGGVGLEQDV